MKSICSILAGTAAEMPDKPLFVFPETRWREQQVLTYSQLAMRSASAAGVIARQVGVGERALLLLPTGAAFWEAFLGCLASGAIAVPLNIPNLNRSSDLLKHVCLDCTPAALITDVQTAELLRRRADRHPEISKLPVITPDYWSDSASMSGAGGTGGVQPATTAFLQYTSGSTANPKGIRISHGNLLANLQMIRDRMGIRQQEDVGVTWLPHYHDMGLVGSYLTTLFTGNTSWCLPPEDFILQPARWLQLISDQQASICGAPDFAYRVCVEKVTEEQTSELDLSSWRVAYIGAERIRASTLQSFADKFVSRGFRNSAFFPCYGLGESTLMATGGPAEACPVIRQVSSAALMRKRIESPAADQDSISLVGSGQVFDGSMVLIVDSETGESLDDELIGEVLLSGPAVTQGYFRRDDLNEQVFSSRVIDGQPRRFLRTGDLGFLSCGELFITGRTRELIIVRGRNLCPEDIETSIAGAHTALASGGTVAFSAELNGQESLIVASELQRSAVQLKNPSSITAAIRQKVVEGCGVNPSEILLLRPASIPRTSSGKPKRLAIRDHYICGDIESLFREFS